MAELTGADGDERRVVVLPVTCCRDGREHLVAEDEYASHASVRRNP